MNREDFNMPNAAMERAYEPHIIKDTIELNKEARSWLRKVIRDAFDALPDASHATMIIKSKELIKYAECFHFPDLMEEMKHDLAGELNTTVQELENNTFYKTA